MMKADTAIATIGAPTYAASITAVVVTASHPQQRSNDYEFVDTGK